MDGIAPRILRNNTPADATSFAFNYRSTHDPNDLDGDPQTSDHEHEYYAEFILRAVQNGATDEWTYLGLIFEPHGIYLREWVDDEVTELASNTAEIEHAQDEWYQARIELSGTGLKTVKVYQGEPGSTLELAFEATTSLDPGGRMGFGMGAVAAWHFDDLATLIPGTGDDYGPQVRNYYDALGRIVKRVVQPEGSSPETVHYHYDGGRLIEEIDESGAVLASYVYGLYIDEVLQMQRGGQDYTYLNDDLHNVVGLVDDTGNVIERYEYGDFGMPSFYDGAGAPLMDGGSPANRSMAGNPFLFTGRRWEPHGQLYDYRTRFMDPQMGRFLRRDTIGLYGDPNNLGNPYTYVGNNPWSGLDPWGRAAEDVEYGLILRMQEVMDRVLAMPVPNELTSAREIGIWRHSMFQQGLDDLREVILLTEMPIDEAGKILSRREINSRVPDVILIVLKEGEDPTDYLNGAKSLKGRVNAVLDLKTGKATMSEGWQKTVANRLGLRTSDVLACSHNDNLAKLFRVGSEGEQAAKLAKRLARGTGGKIAKMIPIAGALLAYKAARTEGWNEDDALAYASLSVIDADLPIDAALFAQENFKRAAESYAAGYEGAYMQYLEMAIQQSDQIRGHEPGIYRQNDRMDAVFGRGGTLRAGDVGELLGE